ncbi:DUF3667 domain-containing protein [Undibacterium sp.]|jgi:hypothetical protein|uniref:DUF3667 domain-containing protein n=1 Tax=Undibacterium sp. TaxID=1914977 RepID=UPI002CEA6FC4|nr:DUF3667 domain-containing protein [Undibacterium sp.]HTD05990.1 DUF3667 domain-containing protein [Undibacterium sp.]
MTSSSPHQAGHCANCGHPAPENFCPACGQKTHIETPSLFEFVHEYLHHYVALEGTLTRTLWMLLSRPGRLTTEYVAGRRQRYIKPLQLYLTISFLFFVLLGLFGSAINISGAGNGAPPNAVQIVKQEVGNSLGTGLDALSQKEGGKAAAIDGESAQDRAEREQELAADREARAKELAAEARKAQAPHGTTAMSDIAAVNAWGERLNQLQEDYKARPAETLAQLQKEAMHRLPYAVFGLMPIFAFLLWLIYFRRRMVYGVHLVFVLHVHAFAFLMFMLSLLPFIPGGVLAAAFAAYFVVALRQVYGGRWTPQILRAAFLFNVYSVCIALAIAVLLGSLV